MQQAISPRLSTGPNRLLILSWLQPGDTVVALRYSHYEAGGWSPAATATESTRMFVNWADLPSVVPLGGERLAAHWLQTSITFPFAYDIQFAESVDNGASWSPASTPHTDMTDSEHGFASIYPGPTGAEILWLDGHDMANETKDSDKVAGTQLRSNAQQIDGLVCDCCQTDVAMAASGPIVVYRDRSPEEIRDIYVSRFIGGRWTSGLPVAIDNWHVEGCPINGPAIAASENRVAVAWFTAATLAQVNVAFSDDSGASFAAPVRVADESTLGRVGVAMLDHDAAAVSWLAANANDGTQLLARRVHRDGSLGDVRLVAADVHGLSVPQMQRSGDDLVFAWSESRADGFYLASALVTADAL